MNVSRWNSQIFPNNSINSFPKKNLKMNFKQNYIKKIMYQASTAATSPINVNIEYKFSTACEEFVYFFSFVLFFVKMHLYG